MIYAFWNNKGGTGKTSLSFQTITMYAQKHPDEKVLAIDLCPQANLSELLLGGLLGNGASNLNSLYTTKRKSVGGYFQDRLPSPFTMPQLNCGEYIVQPIRYNKAIPKNVFLLAGDPIVELQTNAIATLANTQLPGTDTWIAVIDWINDFIWSLDTLYDTIFLDCNPSFSIYTQIAIASANKLILPVMADDSSRRALQNAFSLIYGIKSPSTVYREYSFSTKLLDIGRELPKIHCIVKNRLTQYMGTSSAYHSVLLSIDEDVKNVMESDPEIFTFSDINEGTVSIRDFQTTGVVAFAEGKPFTELSTGMHHIFEKETQISKEYLSKCTEAMNSLLEKF